MRLFSASLGILALGWQRAIQQDKPRSWIAYCLFVLLGGFGMLLSHVLASVAYAALLLDGSHTLRHAPQSGLDPLDLPRTPALRMHHLFATHHRHTPQAPSRNSSKLR